MNDELFIPLSEDEAEELAQQANEFWSRPLFSADELAELDEVTRAVVALIHPPHITIQ